jgi:putative PIN family toxin of toxin-antitoxin system
MTQTVFIIDTNVFVSGLISSTQNSPPVKILDLMLSSQILYVLSPALLLEYQTVLNRPKLIKLHGLIDKEIEQLLSEIVANAIWREPQMNQDAPDKGDNHLWSLLLQFENIILVTGDQLLIDLPPVDKSVITPAIFLEKFLKH